MEKYVVSARKYRPIKFEDVVGQSHVTTTLENAIKNEKVALFDNTKSFFSRPKFSNYPYKIKNALSSYYHQH